MYRLPDTVDMVYLELQIERLQQEVDSLRGESVGWKHDAEEIGKQLKQAEEEAKQYRYVTKTEQKKTKQKKQRKC